MIAHAQQSNTHSSPREAPLAPRSGWDSHLFLLGGSDRARLLDTARETLARLEREPETDAFTFAAALAHQWEHTGVTLAVVATSMTDLVAKLRRSCDRLAKPDCKQIRDAAGTYYTDRPLYREGTLALLFPGEGVQYPDMLADLCGLFPEVEETFGWCDRLAAEAGRPDESLRRILHLPPTATTEERAAAEAQLRRLGPSIFGVLIADLAIARLLGNLELPVSAVAGHSAGELTALLSVGAIPQDAFLGPTIIDILDLMQRQEDERGGPDVALLAVGAGKPMVTEVATAHGDDSIFIAMDNCPHQCVAVGPAPSIVRIETAILERGLVCERLPFRRPYHTPHFEPWMGPYRQLFADIPFQTPRTPVYCCSTGEPFPEGGDAIRDLAVNHWVSPVEFTQLIERMYADGVRLFVEAGPRGNLSAFAEDILRGKPFAAIPANVPRKSGPTQLNHLVAQLAVHGVPVRVGHLFQESGDRSQESGVSGQETGGSGQETGGKEYTGDGLHVAALHDYLNVMEQFLDVQRSVMETFLHGTGSHGEVLRLEDFIHPDFEIFASTAEAAPANMRYALMERVEQFEPGRSILVRRTLDEREDLYADHHTLAGRGVSRTDPGQNGFPVLPMTFSLEGMAEAAALLAPGKVVTAIRDVRLFRWIPFDPEPTVLEIRAHVVATDPTTGSVEVKADVRDLGNSFVKDGANKPAAEAVIVLADHYPPAPEPLPFALLREQPCQITVEDLRRNMFHGPLFQMIRQLSRQGDEGIEGTLEVHARDGWFRSNPTPQVLLDPVLVDAAMHILGAWHLEQPDWTGRILLPFEVQRIEFFGPTPHAGSSLIIRGHNEQAFGPPFPARSRAHAPGRPLVVLHVRRAGTGASIFRSGTSTSSVPRTSIFSAGNGPNAVPRGTEGRCYYLDPPVDLKQPVLRAAGARVTMTPRELVEFRALTDSDEELNAWFFGRLVAKDAVRALWMAKHGEATFPADMQTELVDGRLQCRPRGAIGPSPYPPVAVAVANGRIAAYSAFASRVGIALVPLTAANREIDARGRAARLAAVDALHLPIEELQVVPGQEGTDEYDVTVSRNGMRVRVRTTRQKDFIVASALLAADF